MICMKLWAQALTLFFVFASWSEMLKIVLFAKLENILTQAETIDAEFQNTSAVTSYSQLSLKQIPKVGFIESLKDVTS